MLLAKDPEYPAMIQPGTPQWVKDRIGHLTASRMADAMSFLRDGKPSQKRTDYLYDVVAERLCNLAKDHYVTDAMQHGLDYEEEAKAAYMEATGNLIKPAGFVHHPKIEFFGATPDGLVDFDGLVETKCPTMRTFVKWKMDGEVPEEHKAQMIAQCSCTGRKWVDFVAYDPRILKGYQNLFVRRFTPTKEDIENVESAAIQFLKEVDEVFEAMTS